MPTFPEDGVGSGSGGGGLTLGPVTNSFNGATRAAAETLRDAYGTANASWLAQYDSEPTFTIILTWPVIPVNTVYQSRRSSVWTDVTGLVRGPRGAIGPAASARTDAEIQALIDATDLSVLAGQVTNSQIPAAIMRDSELTTSAVSRLLNLTVDEVNNLLTGATINGQVITFTQNDGSQVTITVPSGTSTGGGAIDLGVSTATSDRLTVVAPSGYSRYPTGTLLIFKASYGQLDPSWTGDLKFYIGTDRYDFYGPGTSNLAYSNLVADTYYLAVVDSAVQLIGPIELSTRQIGDRAFSNPPSNLTDTEKTAVRTAIGAAAGLDTAGVKQLIKDALTAAVTSNTETGIIVTYNADGTLDFVVSSTPVQTHTNYVGITSGALSAVSASDFTVSGVAASLIIPAYMNTRRLLFARPASEPDPTQLYLYRSGQRNTQNQIHTFDKSGSTIQLNSVAHNWWGTVDLQNNFGGFVLEQVN